MMRRYDAYLIQVSVYLFLTHIRTKCNTAELLQKQFVAVNEERTVGFCNFDLRGCEIQQYMIL